MLRVKPPRKTAGPLLATRALHDQLQLGPEPGARRAAKPLQKATFASASRARTSNPTASTSVRHGLGDRRPARPASVCTGLLVEGVAQPASETAQLVPHAVAPFFDAGMTVTHEPVPCDTNGQARCRASAGREGLQRHEQPRSGDVGGWAAYCAGLSAVVGTAMCAPWATSSALPPIADPYALGGSLPH